MGVVVLSGDKAAGHVKLSYSTPSKVEVKNKWSYTSTLPTCFHGVDRENFTVQLTWNSKMIMKV
jgi:hypothetical protein